MPTLTVSLALLETLGVNLNDVDELNHEAARVLEALLVSRGFNITKTIHVRRLPRDEGFLLTQ